jgi:hypothetical protein
MPCTPSDNTLNPVPIPGVPIPGFGLPFSPIQIPLPELDLPTELIEDILALVQNLGALFPSGMFKPNPDFSMKSVLDMIMNILSQISPFLSFYKFIMAALQMFACIIEVLCAIPNPFAVVAKLKKLFTECLPPFINLFPWLALIAMIIAFLLLILALIEYIINTILGIIAAIVKNLEVLADGLRLQDAQSVLAAAQKIANLMCFIQNILAMLVAIGALIAIIEALATIAGITICSDNDPDGCCSPDICPAFVKNTPNGIPVTNGKLIYYNQIGADVADIFASLNIPGIEDLLNIPPIRTERWQLIDHDFFSATYPISLIITPVFNPEDPLAFNIFWPDPLEFKADLSPKRAPYTVDVRVRLNPTQFGLADTKGLRFFRINNCIVVRKPYFGIFNQSNLLDLSNIGGTLNIEGGLVYEDDGTTPYLIDGKQATLNNFIHKADTPASSAGDLPVTDDAVVFDNITFTWKPNAAGLAGHQLVTVGCIPSLNAEKAVQNAIILAEGVAPVLEKITPALPDVATAQTCIADALAIFRKDVSPSGAALFQSTVLGCLNTLKDQTSSIVCAAINAAVSQFKSTIELNTDVQFTTREITATVILKDATGTVLSNNIPAQCVTELESKLQGEVTFGTITPFTYNGSGAFNAKIASKTTGTGQLTVSFDNKIFSLVIPGSGNTVSKIEENALNYSFVETNIEPVPRRDETDVAQTGSGE